MLGDVAPGYVRGARDALRRWHRIAFLIELVVLTLKSVRQQQIFLAAERRRQKIHDAQELLDPIRAGLLEHVHGDEAVTQKGLRFTAVGGREGLDQVEPIAEL